MCRGIIPKSRIPDPPPPPPPLPAPATPALPEKMVQVTPAPAMTVNTAQEAAARVGKKRLQIPLITGLGSGGSSGLGIPV